MATTTTTLSPEDQAMVMAKMLETMQSMQEEMHGMRNQLGQIRHDAHKSAQIAKKFEGVHEAVNWGKNMLDQIRSIKHPLIGWLPGVGKLNMTPQLTDAPSSSMRTTNGAGQNDPNDTHTLEETGSITDTDSVADSEDDAPIRESGVEIQEIDE